MPGTRCLPRFRRQDLIKTRYKLNFSSAMPGHPAAWGVKQRVPSAFGAQPT
jgi:hypothetical protein